MTQTIGGKTIGFWRNKNGQASSSRDTVGACELTTWLRQYPPFQDLSARRRATQVATYVTNVINAATKTKSMTPRT